MFHKIDLCSKNIVLCFKNCLLCLQIWATVSNSNIYDHSQTNFGKLLFQNFSQKTTLCCLVEIVFPSNLASNLAAFISLFVRLMNTPATHGSHA